MCADGEALKVVRRAIHSHDDVQWLLRAVGVNAKADGHVRPAREGPGRLGIPHYVLNLEREFTELAGFAIDERPHAAAKAGAKIQAVWDYKSSLFDHFALTPWNIPDQRYVDTVVALAQKGILFLFDLGYFKVKALASLATAGAYFCCRLNHQTNIYETVAGRVESVQLAACLRTVAPDRLLLEKAIFIGEKAQIASRLIAVRMPEAVVNTRRRSARKNARKKGYTPSQAHLSLLAWNLFITNVSATIWPTATVPKV